MYQIAAGDVEEGPFRDLIVATASDWSDAGWVMQMARESGLTSASRLRQLSIGMIVEGLTLDVLVAGDAGDRHLPWELSTASSIERVVREWPADQPVPGLGTVAWFDLTTRGEALAAELDNDGPPSEDAVDALDGPESDIPNSVRDALATGLVDARRIYDLVARTGLRRGSEIRQLALGVVCDLLNDQIAVVDPVDLQTAGLGSVMTVICQRWSAWGVAPPPSGQIVTLRVYAR